ncbi:MAG: hypothetical protein JWP58_548 [Hymenobacter sp.]|nr:hypothetical protein [Hymenobacter sp.]
MSNSIQSAFYLLTTVEFDVGSTHVKLYGAIQAETDKELSFIVSNDMQFDPKLLPAGDVTTSIPQPFGMTGVELEKLEATALIYNDKQGKLTTDFTLFAAARFLSPKLANLQLVGALAFEHATPRLAYVALSVDKPLTLTDFVQSVIGATWKWADQITNQFAFLGGQMYYLSGVDNYLFQYTDQKGNTHAVNCTRGYHVSTTLELFQDPKYDFEIDLAVVPDKNNKNTIDLKTTAKKTLGFDFVQLENLNLEVSTGSETYFRISTTAVILGTAVAIEVDYIDSVFVGKAAIEGINLALSLEKSRISGLVKIDSIGLAVAFAWARGTRKDSGFSIIRIDGVPQGAIQVMDFVKSLNNMPGSCQQMVSGWFDEMSESKLTPKLTEGRSPSKDKDTGRMIVPLTLHYEIGFGGHVVTSADVDFSAEIVIPNGLRDLPVALLESIGRSTARIAGDILSNENTYKIIALQMIKAGGGKAMARFICRLLEKGLNELAKALAKVAEGIIADTLAAAAELAGVLMAVSLLGVKALLNALEAIWDEIKSWFSGSKSEKEKAEDKIRAAQKNVEGAVNTVNDKLAAVTGAFENATLSTSLNEQSQFVANLVWNKEIQLDEDSYLTSAFEMLTGLPGDKTGVVIKETVSQNTNFPVVKDWSDIPENSQYRMNAAVQFALKGITFMNSATRATITNAIAQLNQYAGDSDAAKAFRDYLTGKLAEFDGYNNNGIMSNWIYAQSDTPSQMTVGESRIGINTRITA